MSIGIHVLSSDMFSQIVLEQNFDNSLHFFDFFRINTFFALTFRHGMTYEHSKTCGEKNGEKEGWWVRGCNGCGEREGK